MATLDANERETFPLFSMRSFYRRMLIQNSMLSKEPSAISEKRFSAPNNCIVDEGIRASLAKEPAHETKRTANCESNNSTIDGKY